MSWIAAAIAGGSIIGGAISANGAARGANAQVSAANRATDTQLSMFNTLNDQQKPYRDAGETSLGDLMRRLGLSGDPASGGFGSLGHAFGPDDLKANLAPNYDFMLKQGQGAVNAQANAMGGLGGNSLKAINDYTQNYASNAYQQAYENYNTNQTNIYNRLASIAGLGQTAGSNSATGASGFASGIAGSQMGAGNAAAAGIVGGANAVGSSINNGVNGLLLSQFLNKYGAPAAAGGAV